MERFFEINTPNHDKGEKANTRLYVFSKNQIQQVPKYRHIILRDPLLLVQPTMLFFLPHYSPCSPVQVPPNAIARIAIAEASR